VKKGIYKSVVGFVKSVRGARACSRLLKEEGTTDHLHVCTCSAEVSARNSSGTQMKRLASERRWSLPYLLLNVLTKVYEHGLLVMQRRLYTSCRSGT